MKAKKRTHKPHWYKQHHYECPECWGYHCVRERQYSVLPEDIEDRHEHHVEYCGCADASITVGYLVA